MAEIIAEFERATNLKCVNIFRLGLSVWKIIASDGNEYLIS